MGFSVLHLQSCGQQFLTKIKISKSLVKNMFFKQHSKISGIPSLHHFIPAVVIIIEKQSISLKLSIKKKNHLLKVEILMAVIFHTSAHFICGGCRT